MHMILTLLLSAVLPSLRDRAALQLELIALCHQLAVLERKRTTRIRLTRFDRFFWVWLYRVWPGCAPRRPRGRNGSIRSHSASLNQ